MNVEKGNYYLIHEYTQDVEYTYIAKMCEDLNETEILAVTPFCDYGYFQVKKADIKRAATEDEIYSFKNGNGILFKKEITIG